MRILVLCAVFLALLPSSLEARSQHYSFWSDEPQKYLGAIQDQPALAGPPALGGVVRAGIVPHHFLAHHLIVDFFHCLKSNSAPKAILLIGPNHYDQGTQPVSLSSLPWRTPFGPLEADCGLVAAMGKSLGLPEDPDAFSGEHSLGVLLPFVKFYFPQAKVLPVLLKAGVPEPMMERLGHGLLEFLHQPDHVILLSMDFAHGVTPKEADASDQGARTVIASLRDEQTSGLQVDCRNGLRALLKALRRSGGLQVDFRDHTNSAVLTGDMEQRNVTSYFTIFFLDPAPAKRIDNDTRKE